MRPPPASQDKRTGPATRTTNSRQLAGPADGFAYDETGNAHGFAYDDVGRSTASRTTRAGRDPGDPLGLGLRPDPDEPPPGGSGDDEPWSPPDHRGRGRLRALSRAAKLSLTLVAVLAFLVVADPAAVLYAQDKAGDELQHSLGPSESPAGSRREPRGVGPSPGLVLRVEDGRPVGHDEEGQHGDQREGELRRARGRAGGRGRGGRAAGHHASSSSPLPPGGGSSGSGRRPSPRRSPGRGLLGASAKPWTLQTSSYAKP